MTAEEEGFPLVLSTQTFGGTLYLVCLVYNVYLRPSRLRWMMMLSGEQQMFGVISLSLDHWLLFLDAWLCGVLPSEFPQGS